MTSNASFVEEEVLVVADEDDEEYFIEEVIEDEVDDYEEEFIEEVIEDDQEEEEEGSLRGSSSVDGGDADIYDGASSSSGVFDDDSTLPNYSSHSNNPTLFEEDLGRSFRNDVAVDYLTKKRKDMYEEMQMAAINQGARRAREEELARQKARDNTSLGHLLGTQGAGDTNNDSESKVRQDFERQREIDEEARRKLAAEIRKVDAALAKKRETVARAREQGSVVVEIKKKTMAELRRQAAREALARNNDKLKAAKSGQHAEKAAAQTPTAPVEIPADAESTSSSDSSVHPLSSEEEMEDLNMTVRSNKTTSHSTSGVEMISSGQEGMIEKQSSLGETTEQNGHGYVAEEKEHSLVDVEIRGPLDESRDHKVNDTSNETKESQSQSMMQRRPANPTSVKGEILEKVDHPKIPGRNNNRKQPKAKASAPDIPQPSVNLPIRETAVRELAPKSSVGIASPRPQSPTDSGTSSGTKENRDESFLSPRRKAKIPAAFQRKDVQSPDQNKTPRSSGPRRKASIPKAFLSPVSSVPSAFQVSSKKPEEPPPVVNPPPIVSHGNFYSIEELRKMKIPGIDYANREQYLSPEDFEVHFKISKEDFASQPKWKRDKAKRSLQLF